MIIIYSTFPNLKSGQKISELLIENKLAACANIFPINSVYKWSGKIVKEKEFGAFIKTKKVNFKKVEQFILKNHPYTTPCIIQIPVQKITPKYKKWLGESC
jgi:periplasmic divalent cation tolerance protein